MKNEILQFLVVTILITIGVYWAAAQGYLGPYGVPGDTYHLLILIAVLFGVYLALFTILRKRRT